MFHDRDLRWRYWLVTLGFLAVGLAGWGPGLALAILLTLFQVGHFAWREGDPAAFSVQVRLAYLGLLLVGLWSPLHWLHWVVLAGTTVRVLVGYCLLARTLSLLPWNRVEPLSGDLLRRTYFTLGAGAPTCAGTGRLAWKAPVS